MTVLQRTGLSLLIFGCMFFTVAATRLIPTYEHPEDAIFLVIALIMALAGHILLTMENDVRG